MKNYEVISMRDLQLFAEGGPAVGTGAGGSTGDTGVSAPAAGVQSGVKENQQTGNPETETVPAAEAQKKTEQPTAADLEAEFEALIKGKFKDLYNAKVTDTIQRRLEGPSKAAEKYKSLAPSLEILAKNYGVDADDIEGLAKAIEADDGYLETESVKTGKPVEQLREERKKDRVFKAMERENADLRQREADRKREEAGQRQYYEWTQQADKAKLVYPGLDLATEIRNPKFVDLLRSNIDVRTAYEVIHKDDIISGAMRTAAQTAAKKVGSSVAANAARPNENGSGQGAATTKIDPSKMTKAQRQEYIRRVAMGERITF